MNAHISAPSDAINLTALRLDPGPTDWRRADYTDWLGKPHDAGAFRRKVRWSDASRRVKWQIAARPLTVY